MTAESIEPEPVPLVRDQAGRLMVHGTRISLDVLVAAFKRGKTPEVIHDSYETVSLADVYAIFTFYLRHRAEVEAYLAEQEREGAAIQARIETEHPLSDGLRAKLLARLDT
ncbi:MAG: DUF433 domain-containing protein [Nocardioidaceae bacterium]